MLPGMHALSLLFQGLGALIALTALSRELQVSRQRRPLEPLPPLSPTEIENRGKTSTSAVREAVALGTFHWSGPIGTAPRLSA